MALNMAHHWLWLVIVGLFSSSVYPEDIDVFKAGGPQDPSPPNILIFLDNTSNWSAKNQGWNKNDMTAKCNGDATCLSYVGQIFGSSATLTQGQVEVASLKLVLNQLVCNATTPAKAVKMNVGLMMIQNGAYIGSSESAGVIKRAILPLDNSQCAAIMRDLDAIFSNITSPAYKVSSSANYGGALFDAFKHYGGHTNPDGAFGNTTGTPIGPAGFGPARFSLKNPALDDALAYTDSPMNATYQNPDMVPSTGDCGGKNHILLVGNTWPNADNRSLLSALKYSYIPTAFPFAGSNQPRLADVWAKFLATTDVSKQAGQQTVLTSVMNIYNASPDASQTALLQSMAKHGGGNYYEVGGSLGGLIASFQNFFISINARNSTFTQPALAQNAGYSGTYQNQLYMGMFRPDKNPLWYGNLKLFQFSLDTSDNLVMADREGKPIQSGTGTLVDDALSFWTHSSTFWSFRCGEGNSSGDPTLCGNPISVSDTPDGAIVEKGGAGQMLREAFTTENQASNSTRNVYTCNPDSSCATGSALSSTRFDAALSSNHSYFGVSTQAEATQIINWLRGVDNVGTNPTLANGARPSLPGDVLHSRAVVMNYNTAASGCSDTANANKNVVAFYGSNHGTLHAIQGGTAPDAGQELWSFVPPEFFGVLKRLRNNSPPVTFPIPVPAGTNPASETASGYFNIATSNIKPHLLDGNLSVFTQDTNGDCKLTPESGDAAYLFATMRRGGRFIYAFNIIDPNNPVFLWKRSHHDTGFSELGESWSELTPLLLADGTAAVIFGAGYDPGADDLPYDTAHARYQTPTTSPAYTPRARTMGRGLFVLNATTGAILKFFGTTHGLENSIPSNVAVASNLVTGKARQAYVGDTGGKLWRISFLDMNGLPTTDTDQWGLTQIASLGDPTDLYKIGPFARRFLFAPNLISIDGGYALMIGAGDREKPFDTTVQNQFYMIRDTGSELPIKCEGNMNHCDLFNANTNLFSPSESSPIPTDAKGWYVTLAKGEKTVGGAATVSGVTYFPTHHAITSAGASCSSALGISKMWAILFDTAQAADLLSASSNTTIQPYTLIDTGGFPASPTPVTMEVTLPGGGTNLRSAVISPPGFLQSVTTPRRRNLLYRYRENLD